MKNKFNPSHLSRSIQLMKEKKRLIQTAKQIGKSQDLQQGEQCARAVTTTSTSPQSTSKQQSELKRRALLWSKKEENKRNHRMC